MIKKAEVGDLRVWWIPQVGGCSPFYVDVSSIQEAKKVLDTLGSYDLFQLKNKIKPDYCNAGGLECYCQEEEASGWFEWYDEESGDSIDEVDL